MRFSKIYLQQKRLAYGSLQNVCRGMHHPGAQFVGQGDKSQAEDMDVRWKIHSIEHRE